MIREVSNLKTSLVGIRITAVSYYLPERILDNQELEHQYGISSDKIFRSTGVKNRHISAPGEIGSDVCLKAAELMFEEHDLDRSNIDFLIFCTEGLDYKAPATAMLLHERLGLKTSCGAMDLPMGCTGFINGLLVSQSLVKAGHVDNVLLLTGDVPSKVIDANDSELCMLFSDGGAATMISRSRTGEIGPFIFGVDGTGFKSLFVERSGSRNPTDQVWNTKYEHLPWGKMHMDGAAIFSFSLKRVPSLVYALLEKSSLEIKDVDHYIFHQANGFLLETLRIKIGIPKDRFHIYLENVGNTVSATIPIVVKEIWNAGKIKKGDKLMLVSFGIGLSWSAVMIEW